MPNKLTGCFLLTDLKTAKRCNIPYLLIKTVLEFSKLDMFCLIERTVCVKEAAEELEIKKWSHLRLATHTKNKRWERWDYKLFLSIVWSECLCPWTSSSEPNSWRVKLSMRTWGRICLVPPAVSRSTEGPALSPPRCWLLRRRRPTSSNWPRKTWRNWRNGRKRKRKGNTISCGHLLLTIHVIFSIW